MSPDELRWRYEDHLDACNRHGRIVEYAGMGDDTELLAQLTA
jgi:hypothetical protein